MRDLPWPGRFDAAFCTGNSFGYLDDEGNVAFLRAVAAALKPGGRFVLETPMVLESLLPALKDRPWFKAGDVYLLIANEYDAVRGRLDIEYTFVSPGGIEVRRGTHRAYAYRELVALMERAGFSGDARAWLDTGESRADAGGGQDIDGLAADRLSVGLIAEGEAAASLVASGRLTAAGLRALNS